MIRHIPGKTNTRADLLLRKDQIYVTKDNRNIKMLRQVEIRWTEASVVLLKEKGAIQDTQLKIKASGKKRYIKS